MWLLVLAAIAGSIKFVDRYLELRRPAFIIDPFRAGPEDSRRPGIPITAYTYYPFTGTHTQPNFSIQGGKLTSGDHGFHIDFDLDNPSPKPRGEYRIIMIGGSAAWGMGASADDKTMDRVMERSLARCNVRVINLSMNGSVTQQNFAMLNLWGHQLEPDAILSFSGNNDAWLPPYQYLYGISLVNGLMDATYPANTPTFLKPLFKALPGFFDHTALGFSVRASFAGDFERARAKDFENRFLPPEHQEGDRFRSIVPIYVHAMKSIKRDFQGIPMMVVFQPYMARPDNPGAAALSAMEIKSYLPRYERFIDESRKQLSGYLNGNWTFFDGHRFYADKLLQLPPEDGVHLGDDKQRIFGEEMARRIAPWACR